MCIGGVHIRYGIYQKQATIHKHVSGKQANMEIKYLDLGRTQVTSTDFKRGNFSATNGFAPNRVEHHFGWL